ncbi:flagellar hook-length control protein FliK [Halomonas citrativorans]|uniref:Flagellar hook-length control protein FliK n=1 Tax=Halomonas citrativorans TaxID=2742612 RepID=A0ABR9FA98_9GAMM|nr:flagellar hook-length control protein FliK [Halomonas citrativorans]MBE0403397.1 flagellar hook-length control protein FliK [Halomonas citrativorans]
MSGITPLIDTLMHQVLGRQGEVSLKHALSEPVKPIPPGEGPRALQGDSRLDGRIEPALLNDLKRAPGSLNGDRLLARGDTQGTPLGSTQTHFSPAARSIADVLLRFPAPPAVIRPPVPLLAVQEAPAATVVAERLESSIRDSGLFYESHLKRWFQGDMARQQLLREPQMQPGPRPLALPSGVALPPGASLQPGAPLQLHAPLSPNVPFLLKASFSESPLTKAIVPGSALQYVSNDQTAATRAAPMPNAAAFTPSAPPGVEDNGRLTRDAMAYERGMEAIGSRGHREVVHESLQSIVRQQLDMLVMPVVRWEGDVWAGIFMALVIHLPAQEKNGDGEGDNKEEDGWRSEMQLDVPNLGAFSVSLWFYRAVLSIDLTTADKATHQYLEQGIPALEQRLNALDLDKVQVRARYMPLESSDAHAE